MPISLLTYQFILYIWISIAVLIFFLLLKIDAPYGRHTTNKWGPQVDNSIGWFLMEFPALAVMLYFLTRNFSWPSPALVMMGWFCAHYINRSFIFPFRLRTTGKKMPVIIMASAIVFNAVNTFLPGFYFSYFSNYEYAWFTDWRFTSGCVIFFTGVWINWKSDNILINLRKPGETGYTLPEGWFFNVISCPNMLGELVEWAGFAILCWNMPALAFLVWSAANLVPRALAHHRWYKNKFKNYPAERKAIIPYAI